MPSDILLDRRAALAAIVSMVAVGTSATAAGPPDQRDQEHSMTQGYPVVELRQYTLRSRQRDVLIELFEREFIEPQNAVGSKVLGQFRDVDDPDRFVWMRGFDDMAARARALESFYGGPVWKEHRSAANATMVDSDNVLLLKPAGPSGGFDLRERAAHKESDRVLTVIHYMDDDQTAPFSEFFESHVRRRIEARGARILATFVSETSPNSFPKLPVRSRDHVFVWVAHFDGDDAVQAFVKSQRADSGLRDDAPEALLSAFMKKPEVLTLVPTARSAIH